MEVRIILGSIDLPDRKHAVGKLTNGLYAVGHLFPGQRIPPSQQFASLDAAADHWFASLPVRQSVGNKAVTK
ncbi:hypothetical protein EDC61_11510 [Sulfuritortus calidifontis]|uniref:Uncharacterized protein n=1 Tax=Sulfuritortus calidifontis TaxID=1914471 RepID=A0A4R3JTA7_9PROT|nr:hypothetical protein [Sulfuritortus calidifontis]TCS70543.1 hypothetical protein EDC61_11510 [Sulfuritortus calidifontis]